MDEEGRIRFYVGTYTDPAQGGGGRSEGIYAGWLDTTSGALEIEGVAATTDSPTFIALNAGRSRLYALRRPPGGPDVVCAYAVDPGSGRLALINEQPCGGMRPAYLSLDRSGRLLFVANYGSGGVASLPVAEDGRLEPPSQVIQHEGNGPVPDRQDGPHAHAIIPDPGNRFALAADLGTDSIYAYPINLAARRLDSKTAYVMKTTPGAGPRHLAFSPGGRTLYASAELDSMLLVFEYNGANGSLHRLQEFSSLPVDFYGDNTASEVAVAPSGRFVYVGNRGDNSIAAFVVDEARTVTPGGYFLTGGRIPRHFAIEPGGHWMVVANQESDNLVAFRIEHEFGELEPAGYEASVPAPTCVVFV